jgi:hypothetical protein
MPAPSTIVRPADPTLRAALRCALLFAAIKLAFQFACTLWSIHLGYSYFRDEFYYIACGRHLAWGYVDHGPIVAVQARVGELLFGDSIFAIRILSAVAGALAIFLTGMLAWALGGARRAQTLAMSGLMVAGVYLGTDGYLSMNSWEPVFWMTCVLALLLVLRGHSERLWWSVFGLSAGLGLLNKPSMVFFLVALGIALLCTAERRLLFTWHAALGIGLLLLIAVPNVIWQIHNHWPTLEFLRNGKLENKVVILSPLAFLGAQVLQMLPWNALLWITGIVALWRGRNIRNARWLALTAIFFFALMLALHAKDYYLAPVYPFLFAAGAIASDASAPRRRWVAPVLAVWIVVNGLVALPFAAPILPPYTFDRYAIAMHFKPKETENEKTSLLPQFYADRFGWNEIVTKIDAAYQALPADQRAEACILTDNYGEAGAINFLGPRLDAHLPTAISGHNSYWMWGPQGCTFRTLIAITGDTPSQIAEHWQSVTIVAHIDEPLAMPYEHKNIYIVRGRRPGMPVDWSDWRHYI